VLGTALAIKMVAYIGIAPVVGAYADRLPRKGLLVVMDLVRAGVALVLPFVEAVRFSACRRHPRFWPPSPRSG